MMKEHQEDLLTNRNGHQPEEMLGPVGEGDGEELLPQQNSQSSVIPSENRDAHPATIQATSKAEADPPYKIRVKISRPLPKHGPADSQIDAHHDRGNRTPIPLLPETSQPSEVSQPSEQFVTHHVTQPNPSLGVSSEGQRGGKQKTYYRIKASALNGNDDPAGSANAVSPNPNSIYDSQHSGFRQFREFLLGKPIPNEEMQHERVDKIRALAILSSDALSSVAYGTEASLAVLITASAVGYNLFIGLAIMVLLGIVAFSYRQTIKRYPGGGGSYIVAKDNLNQSWALVAAAALLIDYVLTVSVSVSAGVDALTSAFRFLEPSGVWIGLVLIALIMLINLRGVRESGTIFAAPTYIFVGSFLVMILIGIVEAIFNGGLLHQVHLAPPINPQSLINQGEHLSLLLVLTAFASGCSAMTGTEAISDAVPIFKGAKPADQARNASQTLVIMASLLAIMYGGTTYIAWRYGFEPQVNSHPTVISIMAGYFFSGNMHWFFYVFQFATTLILVLAANTSFADFPRLAFFLARDEFLPHLFQIQGDRLAYNTGIIVLAILSGVLLIIFNGNTDALINLYALGVFLAFTLSQSSMVVRWVTRKEPGWHHGLPISAFGAFSTLIVTIIIAVTKFTRGAWVVVILIPLMYAIFQGINRHYRAVKQQLEAQNDIGNGEKMGRHLVIVPIAGFNPVALRGLYYAHTMSRNVIAVNVVMAAPLGPTGHEEQEHEILQHEWNRLIASDTWKAQSKSLPEIDLEEAPPVRDPGHREPVLGFINGPKLVVIQATNRAMVGWIVRFIDTIKRDYDQDRVTVVLPEFVPLHVWEWILHNQVALRLKWSLLRKDGIVTANVPYFIPPPKGESAENQVQNADGSESDPDQQTIAPEMPRNAATPERGADTHPTRSASISDSAGGDETHA